MPRSQRIMRGIATNYLVFFIGLAIPLLVTPTVLSYLGQSAYGLWIALVSTLSYLGLLDFGMATAVVKYVAEYSARKDHELLSKTVSSIFALYWLFGLIALFICLLLASFIPGLFHLEEELSASGQVAFFILGLSFALGFPLGIFGGILYGYQRLDVRNVLSIVRLASGASFMLLFLFLGWGLIGLAVAVFLSDLLYVILNLFAVRWLCPEVRIRLGLFDTAVLRKAFSYSVYMFLISLSVQIVFNIDNLIIGMLLNVSLVTTYSLTYRPAGMAMQLVWKLVDVLFPVFSELDACQDKERLRTLFLESVKLSVAMAFSFALLLIVFTRPFIALWVGAENFAGMAVLACFAALCFLHSFVHVGAVMLQALAKIREMSYLSIAEALLHILLSVALAKGLGVMGVALATIVAQVATNAWFIPWFSLRQLGLTWSKYVKTALLPPLLAGGPAVILALVLLNYFYPANLIYLVVDCGLVLLVYAGSYLALAATSDERRFYMRRFQELVSFG